jgi:hypothetical protein
MENKCKNNNHIALFCLSDMKDSRIKVRGYQCVCLECDEMANIKDNIKEMNNVVYRQTELDPFYEYMSIVRGEYKNYIREGKTPLEAVQLLNSSNEDIEEPKVFKKTTNN